MFEATRSARRRRRWQPAAAPLAQTTRGVTHVWASYWYGDYVVVADNARGIDILKWTEAGKKARKQRKEVVAPKMSPQRQSFLAGLNRNWRRIPSWAGSARCRCSSCSS